MSSTELPVAVIGAGLMGRWHAHYAARSGARVVAVVDPSQPAAEALARRLGARAFAEMPAMLAATSPTVAHICTPLGTHVALATLAVASGVHALVEKPLAAGVAETASLLDAARARGVHVCPVHQFAFQRGVARAAREVGRLGEPVHAQFTIHSAGAEGHPAGSAEDIVADVIPHPLSVLQALWPANALVPGDWGVRTARPGELHASGRTGAMPVDVRISMNARPTRCDLEVACTGGTIHVDFFHGYASVREGHVSRGAKITQPFRIAAASAANAAANLAARAWRRELAYPGLAGLVEAFYRAARGNGASPVTPEQALAVATVREHLLHERERVRLPA